MPYPQNHGFHNTVHLIFLSREILYDIRDHHEKAVFIDMKAAFTCDLHGRRPLYEEAFEYAVAQKAACLLIGGDLLPTRLKHPYRLMTGGFDFTDALRAQFAFIDSFLARFLDDFSCSHPGIRILYVPGNHDWSAAVEHLKSSAPAAACVHIDSMTVGDVVFTGYGCVTDSSFWVKDFVRRDKAADRYVPSRYPLVSTKEGITISPQGAYAVSKPSIGEELRTLPESDPAKTICIFHCPPYATGLDTLYTGRPIGSISIAEYLRSTRPLVSLHGHIHEAPYMSGFFHTTIGPTLAVNPGHHPKRLHAVSFDTDDPVHSLTHSVFGAGPVDRTEFDRAKDRYTRMVKGFFMKRVLMK